jgi:dTDP-4-amino-4,6-dideoxygalactose transaminase
MTFRVSKAAKHIEQLIVRDAFFRISYFYGTAAPEDLERVEDYATDGEVEVWHRLAAERCGADAAFSFAAGRMALFAILTALEVGPGDEVIIPAFTCVAVPNAIRFSGATPVYADVDPDTFNVSIEDVKRRITPRTRVVMAQHTFGNPADIKGLKEITETRRSLALVEDACLALGASYGGQPVGSWGDAAFFSTDATKMVCTDVGGVAVTNDSALASRIQDIWARTPEMPGNIETRIVEQFKARYHATRPETYWRIFINRLLWRAPLPGKFESSDESDGCLPTNYPYPARFLRSMVGVADRQLRDIERNVAHRQTVARHLDALFGGHAGSMRVEDGATCSWVRYPLLVDDPQGWYDAFDKYVKVGDWFDSPAYGWHGDLAEMGYTIGSCPQAESMHKRIINFPTHYGMDGRVLAKMERLWERHRSELR